MLLLTYLVILMLDFFEMVSNCHIMHQHCCFFGMDKVTSEPSHNVIPHKINQWTLSQQWEYFSQLIGRLIYLCESLYVAVAGRGHTNYFPLEFVHQELSLRKYFIHTLLIERNHCGLPTICICSSKRCGLLLCLCCDEGYC